MVNRLVAAHGGRPMRAVTCYTSLVVTGAAPGSKLNRAKTLGIPVVSEQQFLRRSPLLQHKVTGQQRR